MKSPLILLFTRDGGFAQSVRDALFETDATVLIARDVRDGLQIVWQRGRELDSALMDFDDGCRGRTLLSAVHNCYDDFGEGRACMLSRLCEWRSNLSKKTVVAGKLCQSDGGCDRLRRITSQSRP